MPIKQTIYTGKKKQSWPTEFAIPLIPPKKPQLSFTILAFVINLDCLSKLHQKRAETVNLRKPMRMFFLMKMNSNSPL
ncbi:hypothetical protein CROQUDRAFT_110235 [Cronartium quercuum f. sp. fusiforme G11]|uniref:Uncharacterized protein n=1 Tax=Cronartium quercuum f. sp. fusiforme G11 TaxID=708437 RepID=A0A9P6T7A8_9BASI|nr:hypothetical protein CROQUDRAFT_110235 [Cronartium quercuum f. sp. fusiforme G11]